MKHQNKKTIRNIIIGVISIALLLLVLNYFGIFSKISSLSISYDPIPTLLEEGVNPDQYYCKLDATGGCYVTGIMDCNVDKSSGEYVKSRVSGAGYNEAGHWIVLEDSSTSFYDLISYYRGSTSTGVSKICSWGQSRTWIQLPYEKWAFIVTSGTTSEIGLWIAKDYTGSTAPTFSSSGSCNWWRYKQSGSGANTDPSCSGGSNEICGGDIIGFNCDGKLIDQNNNLVAERKYQSLTSGTTGIKTSEKYINAGTTARMTGGDKNYVQFRSYKIVNSCTEGRKVCSGEGGIGGDVYKCHNNLYELNETCSYGCNTGRCLSAFDAIEISIENDNQQNIEQFGAIVGENINIYIKAISGFNLDNVKVDLRDSSATGEIRSTQSSSISSGETKKFVFNDFSNILPGQYYLVITITSAGLDRPEIIGDESGEFRYFNVVSNFQASLSAPGQWRKGIRDTVNLYQNYPIEVILNMKSGSTLISPDEDPVISITVDNLEVQYNLVKATGKYTYTFMPPKTGALRIEGTAKYFGVTQQFSRGGATIEQEPLLIYFDSQPETTIKIGNSFEFIFKAEDSQGRPVDLTSYSGKVFISDSSSEITGIQRINAGIYKFAYIFDKNAVYEFKISGTAGGFLESAPASTGQIQAVEEDDLNKCNADSDCKIWEKCDTGKCAVKVSWILILVGITFGIIILIILIIKFRKGKEPSIGI